MIYYRQNEITINSPNDLKQLSYDELFEIWVDKRHVWKRPRYFESKVVSLETKRREKEKQKIKSENEQQTFTIVDRILIK